ncbi:MAG TPA: STAS domain-containing protein [Desulfomonilaceae bacterium]|nr:STAS domain-containing protein [Desulfomonilaceae bacterium]
MDISFSEKEGCTVCAVQGRIDTVTAPDFEKKMQERITRGANRFVVDLSKLEYISSAGLRSILVAGKSSKATGGELCCCSLQGVVKKVFEVSGFTSLFPIFDSLDEALKK